MTETEKFHLDCISEVIERENKNPIAVIGSFCHLVDLLLSMMQDIIENHPEENTEIFVDIPIENYRQAILAKLFKFYVDELFHEQENNVSDDMVLEELYLKKCIEIIEKDLENIND